MVKNAYNTFMKSELIEKTIKVIASSTTKKQREVAIRYYFRAARIGKFTELDFSYILQRVKDLNNAPVA